MNIELNKIDSEFKIVKSWNLTYKKKSLIYYPKDKNQLKNILKNIKKNNLTFSIKTGNCSYDGKSINLGEKNVIISLKKFDKLIYANKNKIKVQSGAKLKDILLDLKNNNLTMFAIPGGEHITVGGAISANVIGKDSDKKFGSFGDSIESISVMFYDGSIKKLKKSSKKFSLFVGSFGIFGIILDAEIKVRKIKSNNLKLSSFKIKKISEIKYFIDKKADYKYIQINPFFSENNIGILFQANYIANNDNLFKEKNFNIFFYDIIFFRIISRFMINYFWKFFYIIFTFINKKKSYTIDLHNFYFSSKYKHMVPYLCKKGLLDYEILVKNNIIKTLFEIRKILKDNNFYPIYFIIKKLYKSKKNYFYSFNDNGYSMAIAFDQNSLKNEKKEIFENFLKKKKFKINICKTDSLISENFIKKYKKFFYKKQKNNFMSIFKNSIQKKGYQ